MLQVPGGGKSNIRQNANQKLNFGKLALSEEFPTHAKKATRSNVT